MGVPAFRAGFGIHADAVTELHAVSAARLTAA